MVTFFLHPFHLPQSHTHPLEIARKPVSTIIIFVRCFLISSYLQHGALLKAKLEAAATIQRNSEVFFSLPLRNLFKVNWFKFIGVSSLNCESSDQNASEIDSTGRYSSYDREKLYLTHLKQVLNRIELNSWSCVPTIRVKIPCHRCVLCSNFKSLPWYLIHSNLYAFYLGQTHVSDASKKLFLQHRHSVLVNLLFLCSICIFDAQHSGNAVVVWKPQKKIN